MWHTTAPGTAVDVDLLWKAYLRRFDQEHFHHFAKVHLGLARARLLSAHATDRWMALVITGYTQLRAAAPLVADQPKPWQRTTAPGRIPTPCRTRAGFRRRRAARGTPADTAKPSGPVWDGRRAARTGIPSPTPPPTATAPT
jgi:hypothetical protein